MKKVLQFFSKSLLLLMALLYGFFSFNTFINLNVAFTYESKGKYFIIILLVGFAIAILYGLYRYLCVKCVYHYKLTWFIMSTIIVLIQLVYLFNVQHNAIWDVLDVVTAAERMLQMEKPMIPSNGGYFEMYGNNNLMVILLYWFFKIMRFFGVDNLWIASQILNVVAIDIGILFCCLILKRRNLETAFAGLCLWMFNPYTYVFVSYVYTNTFSFAAICIEIYIILCLYQTVQERGGKIQSFVLLSILLGIAAALAFFLRPTNFIIIMAGAILIGFLLIYKEIDRKRVCIFAVTFLAFFSLTFLAWKQVDNYFVDDGMRQKNFPITHWIAMGANQRTNGSFALEDENETRELETKEERIANTVQKIKSRYNDMLVSGTLISHFNYKLIRNCCLPADSMTYYSNANNSFGFLYGLTAGGNSSFFKAYFQVFVGTLYLAVMLRLFFALFAKEKDLLLLLYALSLFGANLFYLIWESGYLYMMCFMPILILIISPLNFTVFNEKKANVKVLSIGLVMVAAVLCPIMFPSENNWIYDANMYTVNGEYWRPHLESRINKVSECSMKLKQSFTIGDGKNLSEICLGVENIPNRQPCVYRFSLFGGADANLLYETVFSGEEKENDPYYGDLYNIVFTFPETYESGNYYFTIEGIDQSKDSLSFRYRHELCDENPSGYLTIDGEVSAQKDDLVISIKGTY